MHVDPAAHGLRVRVRWGDRRLEELPEIPLELAFPVGEILRGGKDLPWGYQLADVAASSNAWWARRRSGADRRHVCIQGTPCVGGVAFCLQAPEREDPGSPARGHGQLWEGRIGPRLEAATAVPGGLFLVMGPDAAAVRRALRQLAAHRREQYPLVIHLGPGEAPDLPDAHRALPRMGRPWPELELDRILKQGPDRIVIDPPHGERSLERAAMAALSGPQVLSGLPAASAGLSLARWVHSARVEELFQAALRGLLHAVDLPRLCTGCRRLRADLPPEDLRALASLLRGGAASVRGGCVRCHGTGYQGTVGLRAWTPTDAALLAEIRACSGFERRAATAVAATAAAGAAMRDQLGRALAEGWVDAPAARRGLACLEGLPE